MLQLLGLAGAIVAAPVVAGAAAAEALVHVLRHLIL
jgi:hypothetical protein